MTLTPAQHYQRADELVAELDTYDPIAATRVPATQFKLRLAEVHARLAQSPWWPDMFPADHPDPWPADEFEQPTGDQVDILRARIHGPQIETRSATGDRL